MSRALLLFFLSSLLTSTAFAQSARATKLLEEADVLFSRQKPLDALRKYAEAQKADRSLADGERIARFAAGDLPDRESSQRDRLLATIYAAHLQRMPGDADAAATYAAVLKRLGKTSEAIKILERAAATRGAEKVGGQLALMLWEAGERKRALAHLSTLAESADADASFAAGAAAYEIVTGKRPLTPDEERLLFEIGYEALENAWALEPAHAEPVTYLGLLAREEGRRSTDAAARSALFRRAERYRGEAKQIGDAHMDHISYSYPWSVEIVQGRRTFNVGDSAIDLERKPFSIRVRVRSDAAQPVMLHASPDGEVQRLLRPGFHLVRDCAKELIPPCAGTGMAEGPDDINRLIVGERAMHYLYDAGPSDRRWGRVSTLGEWIAYERDVEYLSDSPVAASQIDTLYLTVIISPRGGRRIMPDEVRKAIVRFRD